MAAINPFEYLNAISSSKEDMMDRENGEKDYCPFLTNRGLSQHQDTVLLAQYMNLYHQNLPYALQFQFLRHVVPKRKRYGKWAKKEISDKVTLIQEYFGYNHQRAEEISNLISNEDCDNMRQSLFRGGLK